jgi:protein-S-isoprenylcysteine O-methyltransferase Ste14
MTTICAYAIIAFFVFVEVRLRQGKAAKSLETGMADQNSTKRIGQAFGVMFLALLLAPILNYLGVGILTIGWLAWLGVILMLVGLGLRIWASRTLGAFYTRTLLIQTEQRIVDSGPYRYIRNPGYLGDLIMFISAGFAVMNWISVIAITVAMVNAYVYRIRTEETMLQSAFGEQFAAYQTRTWRLIPLIY